MPTVLQVGVALWAQPSSGSCRPPQPAPPFQADPCSLGGWAYLSRIIFQEWAHPLSMVVHLLGIGRFNRLAVLLIHWVLAQKSNIKAAPQTLKKHERSLKSFSFCPVLHAGSHTFSPPLSWG